MADEDTPKAGDPPHHGRRGSGSPPPEDVRDQDREPPPASVDPEIVEHIRQADIEPYTGLRWVGTLFKAAAIFLLVALVGEFIAGLRAVGWTSLPTLLGETARTFVLMVVLWGAGDLVRLLVAVGHDIRAQRIFLTRLEWRSRQGSGHPAQESGAGIPAAAHQAARTDRAQAPAGPGAPGAVGGAAPRGGQQGRAAPPSSPEKLRSQKGYSEGGRPPAGPGTGRARTTSTPK